MRRLVIFALASAACGQSDEAAQQSLSPLLFADGLANRSPVTVVTRMQE
jgi:hypothetical protein